MNGHLLIAIGIWCLCLGQVVTQMDEKNFLFDNGILFSEERPHCEPLNVELNDAEKDEFLKAHNDARRREDATNMFQMVWDEQLAINAQAKANTCRYVHSMFTDCNGVDLGQNLMANWSYGPDYPPINYTDVTYAWANERIYWDYGSKECQQGKQCGHWRILTGAGSWRLGCGKAQCSTLVVHGVVHSNSNFVVCDYGPIYRGFLRGALPCSECYNLTIDRDEKGYTCDNGLCVPCVPMRNSECKCGPRYSCNNGGRYSPEICGCKCPRENYGIYCEKSCRCVDKDGFPCQLFASECTNEKHKYWLPNNCQKTCNTCDQRPASCKYE